MPGSGTRSFLDPDHYEASLRQAQIELMIACGADFRAHLTWAELHDLQLLRCVEDFPRIGYVYLPPRLVFVAFPAPSGPLPVWGGMELQAGDIMFHSRGERLHQSTTGPAIWNVIAMDPVQFESYGRALSGKPLSSPPEGQLLRPSPRDAARLRRLHAQACRLAETKPKILAHPEVARAIEQGLIHALVTCLAAAKVREDGPAKPHHARIMVRFEEVLAEHLGRPLRMPDLCELIGVNDRTLRSCCAEFLGISPSRYVLLRRLKQVRRALQDADPHMVNVAELAGRFGFTEPGRFAGAYRAAFGEAPSTTLQRIPETRFTGL
ncbi:MAG TPA: helix-turn-helix domain-containing protein [Stellaceae bacterium]|nr:helix-turn-helix domain-containing protein [Stellaceae bacterium]